jgi:hypothetical protein
LSECKTCAFGFASPTTDTGGATSLAAACVGCIAGKYFEVAPGNVEVVHRCSSCLPGFYNDAVGAQFCNACQPGTKSTSAGASVCTNCDVSSWSTIAAISCGGCPPGKTLTTQDPFEIGRASCRERVY